MRGEPLAWALREAVTNVLRHSGASHCRVELTRNGRTLRLIVADDGVGPLGTRTEGGLAGLRERLRAAGGDLDVQPGGDGFTLTAWVPDGPEPIRVLLAEDQAMMRGALAVLLNLEDDVSWWRRFGSGTEIVAEALRARPDVALLDIELPGRNGLTPPPTWPASCPSAG